MNLNLLKLTTINLFYKMMIKSNCPKKIKIFNFSKNYLWTDNIDYSVSKSAINALTFGLAKELNNFTVISVAPSAIDTQFQKIFFYEKKPKIRYHLD